MKTINIFVACSPTSEVLNDQKEALVKFCRELNTKFADEYKDYYIKPIPYEDLERRMEVFENHIKNIDIILFLIDNKRDADLVKELELAMKRSNKFHKPEILVFASDKIKENKAYDDEIKQICANGGWLYEPLKDTEDLLNNVKEKINRYVRSYKSILEIRKWSKARYYGLPIAIVLAIMGVAYFLCRPLIKNKMESRQLLIMGGGSAINYIVENTPSLKNKDDLNTMRWHYAAMASGNSYGLIAEEVLKNYDGYKSHPYYPIVLSAQKVSEDNFLKTSYNKSEFNKTGIVIGVFLGFDWLVAYGSKDAFPKPDSIIHADVLNTIIADQVLLLKSQSDSEANDFVESDAITVIKPTTIYTTSDNSGTLNAYKGICDSSIIHYNDIEHHIFSDIVTISEQNHGKEWIALGSKYYHPQNKLMDIFTVLDGSNNRITKKIYVYFMLYNHDGLYVLPYATKRFLKKIQLPDATIDSLDNPQIISRIINDSTILYDSIFKNYDANK